MRHLWEGLPCAAQTSRAQARGLLSHEQSTTPRRCHGVARALAFAMFDAKDSTYSTIVLTGTYCQNTLAGVTSQAQIGGASVVAEQRPAPPPIRKRSRGAGGNARQHAMPWLLAKPGHSFPSAHVVRPPGCGGSGNCIPSDVPASIGRDQRCHCAPAGRAGQGASIATACLSSERWRRHLAHDPGNLGFFCCRKIQFGCRTFRAQPCFPTGRIVLLERTPKPVHRNLLGGLACLAEPAPPPGFDLGPACATRGTLAQLHPARPRRLRLLPRRSLGHGVGPRRAWRKPSAGHRSPDVSARDRRSGRAVARTPGVLCNALLSCPLGGGSRRPEAGRGRARDAWSAKHHGWMGLRGICGSPEPTSDRPCDSYSYRCRCKHAPVQAFS